MGELLPALSPFHKKALNELLFASTDIAKTPKSPEGDLKPPLQGRFGGVKRSLHLKQTQ